MARTPFNVATLVSVAFLAITLFLFVATFALNPQEHRLSVTPHFHVGVSRGYRGATLGCLVVFSDAEYGPYRGSIIQITDDEGHAFPPMDRKIYFDAPGAYYRYFRWPEGETLWTLMFSLWYPLLLSAIFPAAWLLFRLRSWRSYQFRLLQLLLLIALLAVLFAMFRLGTSLHLRSDTASPPNP